jgi:c-di-GMP-binding flagellar brake protein YcgR
MMQRRIYRRFSFDGNVDFRTKEDKRRFVRAYLDDISLEGLRMRSQEKIPVHEKVYFALTTPLSRDSLLGEGSVRHVTLMKKVGEKVFYIGIKFERIKRNRIKGLIGKAYGIRKKPFLSRQRRGELSFMVKISPFLAIGVWLINVVAAE